jgi:alkylation response protein AidB-like acyl-CoA dehydrogenase
MTRRGVSPDVLDAVLHSLRQSGHREMPLSWKLQAEAREEFPHALIKKLMGPEIGLHLIYIPESCGGLGGGAYDVYRVSETMAGIDLGLATAFLAISLGLDPIVVGGTEAQKQRWLTRVAEEGLIVAYGVTEPTAPPPRWRCSSWGVASAGAWRRLTSHARVASSASVKVRSLVLRSRGLCCVMSPPWFSARLAGRTTVRR